MNTAILLAAGESKRFGSDKTLETLLGKPVLAHSLALFETSQLIDAIFVVTHSGNEKKIKDFLKRNQFSKVKKILRGGKTRFESAKRAIKQASNADIFVIHNAANPLATQEDLERCFKALKKGIYGVAVGRKITSTIKKIGRTLKTIPREQLWEVETPQVVRAKEFTKACRRFPSGDFTDDLAALEKAGFKTALVETSPHNKKITTREDLEMMKFFVGDIPKYYSAGIGEDSHAFSSVALGLPKGDRDTNCLTLGGIKILHLPALEAESDGDVMLHALCNAIASARGKGSLGTYATKLCNEGIKNSRIYLQKILRGRKILSASFSFEGSRPKIDPLTPMLKKNLSNLLKIEPRKIGITATSGENLTPFGKGEAIKCTAQILLCEK